MGNRLKRGIIVLIAIICLFFVLTIVTDLKYAVGKNSDPAKKTGITFDSRVDDHGGPPGRS